MNCADDSLAGQPQWRSLAAFDAAQSRLFARDVVARHRHDVLALCELYLHDHHGLLTERHLGSGQIELPHPTETRIVDALDRLAMREEPLPPGLQRLRIMQPENLDVGDEQAGTLDRRQHFRKRGYVAARKDVFGDERIGGGRPFGAPDRVQQHDAVRREKLGTFTEIGVIEPEADVLEHSDRYDAVEGSGHGAVILQLEFDGVPKPLLLRSLPGHRKLLARERDPGHSRIAHLGKIERKAAPARTDVEHAMPGPDEKLGGDVALFRELRVVERLVGILEIRTAVL